MAIRLSNNRFKCPICGEIFSQAIACDMHRDKEHDIIYVPLLREDLNRLNLFIRMKDDTLLTRSLVTTIMNFAKQSAKAQAIKDEEY
jgi:hypothetical protein